MKTIFSHDDLIDLHNRLCEKSRETMKAKNADYTGGSGDCFANFRSSEFLGVDPVVGIMMRCLDKFKRILTFTKNGKLSVQNESVDDAIMDVLTYMVLMQGLIEEKRILESSVRADATTEGAI